VFYGGVEPELRAETWRFLLGYYPPGSTKARGRERGGGLVTVCKAHDARLERVRGGLSIAKGVNGRWRRKPSQNPW
jgi:hypothetical protein